VQSAECRGDCKDIRESFEECQDLVKTVVNVQLDFFGIFSL